jgi:hypothetical protein
MVGSFWGKDELKTLNSFRDLSKVVIQDGRTVRLWYGKWSDNLLSTDYPELFSYAINKDYTLMQAKETAQLQDMFHLPLSEHAFTQFQLLSTMLQEQGTSYEQNTWTYSWGSSRF